MIFAKDAMINCHQFIIKKKAIIEKYDLRTVSEWITITKDSNHSMTSKTIVPENSSIYNQDVVSVKDVGGIDELEIFSYDVNVEEAVAGINELEFSNVNDKNGSTVVSDIEALVVKVKEEQKNLKKILLLLPSLI